MIAHPMAPPGTGADQAYEPTKEDLILLAEVGFAACLHGMADRVEPLFQALDLWRPDHAVAAIGRGLALLAMERPDDAVRALDETVLAGKKAAENGRALRLQALYLANRLPEADVLRQQLMEGADGPVKEMAARLPELLNLERR